MDNLLQVEVPRSNTFGGAYDALNRLARNSKMFLSRIFAKFRHSQRLAKEDQRIPLPATSYESVFEFIRRSSFGWVADISSIKPTDLLVARDRFDSGDISYFADDLQNRFGFDIPRSEWEKVATFDDLTQLLLKYLERSTAPHPQ